MGAMPLFQILAIVFSVTLVLIVIETIRRNLLNVRYALMWLGAGLIILALSVYRPLLDWIARRLEIAYPPSLLFLIAFVFMLLIVLHYSLVISSHRSSIRRLAQSIALLERALAERTAAPPEPAAAEPNESRSASRRAG